MGLQWDPMVMGTSYGNFGTCLVPSQYLGNCGLGDTIRDFRGEPSCHDPILDLWDFSPKPLVHMYGYMLCMAFGVL